MLVKHILKSNASKDVQFTKIICPHLDYKRIFVSFVNSVLIKFRRKNSFSQSRKTREKSVSFWRNFVAYYFCLYNSKLESFRIV